MSPKKICVFYSWGSTNAGDHALILGAISLLRKAFPDAELTVVSRYGLGETELVDSTEKIRLFDPKVNVLPSSFGGSRANRLGKLKQQLSGAVQGVTAWVAPRLALRWFRRRPAFQAIVENDLLVQNGGNLYYWNSDRKAISRLIAFAMPLFLGRALGKKTGFLPQTIGTFEDKMGRRIADFIADNDFVMFRDSASKSNLAAQTELRNPNITVPDLVHFLPAQPAEPAQQAWSLPESFNAVTLRDESLGDYGVSDYEQDRENTRRRIMEIFPEALASVHAQTDIPYVIVVQVQRDKEISQQLCNALDARGIPNTMIECYDPTMLMSLYQSATILIAMRLHSQIFAINSGTPSVAVWRRRLGKKIPSMMKDLDCDAYCHEFSEVTVESLIQSTLELLEKRDDVTARCHELLDDGKSQAVRFLRDNASLS